ncbi:uncharacterized protein LOC112552571 [Pogonomyrmex barbatus]|uniref:Uncharacterized protein LOC112552571 n=1 Tax=Pogonomyrmex barbatus TaxID=144034 RepID=A0A8N1S7B9_9HYME|nr:uncharacterized protein LOC112552571 [Pogonomyrmex barbatus]
METNKINEKSELHERYVKFPITNITLLLSTVNRSNDQLRQEIIDFNDEITKEELNINNLEERKMFLCYRYQTIYHSQNKEQSEISETDNNLTVSDIFPSMKAIFPPHRFRSSSQISLVCDIVILQIVLYFDISSSVGFMQNFLSSHQDYLMNDTSRIMYMQIMERLLEFLRLRPVDPDVYNPSGTYIEILKSWIETYKNSEWKTLASIFPKLIDIFSWDDIMRPLWYYILHDVYPQPNVSYCRILPILSAITDTCFIPFDSTNYVLHDIYYNRAFWSLILKGLGASSSQYRKQALYIMKTAVNSLNESIRSNLITSKGMKEEITPFVCDQIDISPPMDCVKEKFFLVYEALEQEQDDLVMPALIHVTDLIEANKKHDICSCFDIVWLRCIFEKILTHESTQVTKWGVSHVLKLDEAIFDVHFLEIFINTLNNPHLYECQSVEDRPEIVGELTEFFKRAQKSYLFKRFVRHINKNIIWEPLTIFYVIYALRIISPKEAHYCAWETDELKAIKLLVEKSLSSSSSIPSTACQIELLRAICNYVRQIDDLPLFADVLATFSCLAKETDSWNIITIWLSGVLSDTAAKNSKRVIAPLWNHS